MGVMDEKKSRRDDRITGKENSDDKPRRGDINAVKAKGKRQRRERKKPDIIGYQKKIMNIE